MLISQTANHKFAVGMVLTEQSLSTISGYRITSQNNILVTHMNPHAGTTVNCKTVCKYIPCNIKTMPHAYPASSEIKRKGA
ncbi:Uncharacterised protein [Shigella sonnei]|nr:Uncharacterised protein [Shigella sonnei]